jgi:hypothetical protein
MASCDGHGLTGLADFGFVFVIAFGENMGDAMSFSVE